MTSGDATAHALSLACRLKMSLTGKKLLFEFMKTILAPSSQMRVPTWEQAARALLLTADKEIKYHACENDCEVYYDSRVRPNVRFAQTQTCVECKAKRLHESGKPKKVHNHTQL